MLLLSSLARIDSLTRRLNRASSSRWMALSILFISLFAGTSNCGSCQDDLNPGQSDRQIDREFDSLEDVPRWLEPDRDRSEAEQDRVDAAGRFAHGRWLIERREIQAGLDQLARACRYDPASPRLATEFLRLALDEGRTAQALRIAKQTDLSKLTDTDVMVSLAGAFSDRQEYALAVALYDDWLEREAETAELNVRLLVRLERGRLLFVMDDHARAAEEFDIVVAAIDATEDSPAERFRMRALLRNAHQTFDMMGEAYLLAGQLDQAEDMFRRGHQARKNATLFAYNLARIHLKRQQWDDAIESIKSVVSDPEFDVGFSAWEILRDALEGRVQGDLPAARADLHLRLDAAAGEQPTNDLIRSFQARQWKLDGDLEKAASRYRELLEVSPSTAVIDALVDIYLQQHDSEGLWLVLGLMVDVSGDLDLIDPDRERLTADQPAVAKLLERARALQEERTDDSPIIDDGGRALAAALLFCRSNQLDDAAPWFESAIATAPRETDQLCRLWSIELMGVDRYGEANQLLRRAIEFRGTAAQADLLYLLAGSLTMEERYEEALAAAQQAGEEIPDAPMISARIAWVEFQSGETDKARQRYVAIVESLRHEFGSDALREVLRDARMALSAIDSDAGRMAAAEEWLEQVLDEFPDDAGALNDLGYVWVDQGKHLQRGYRMVKRAVEQQPDSSAYRDSLGWALFRLQNYEEAKAEFIKSLELRPDDPDVLMHLGDTYRELGNLDKAIDHWRRAEGFFDELNQDDLRDQVRERIKRYESE